MKPFSLEDLGAVTTRSDLHTVARHLFNELKGLVEEVRVKMISELLSFQRPRFEGSPLTEMFDHRNKWVSQFWEQVKSKNPTPEDAAREIMKKFYYRPDEVDAVELFMIIMDPGNSYLPYMRVPLHYIEAMRSIMQGVESGKVKVELTLDPQGLFELLMEAKDGPVNLEPERS